MKKGKEERKVIKKKNESNKIEKQKQNRIT